MTTAHRDLKDQIAVKDHRQYCMGCRAFTEMKFYDARGTAFSGMVRAVCGQCNHLVNFVKAKPA